MPPMSDTNDLLRLPPLPIPPSIALTSPRPSPRVPRCTLTRSSSDELARFARDLSPGVSFGSSRGSNMSSIMSPRGLLLVHGSPSKRCGTNADVQTIVALDENLDRVVVRLLRTLSQWTVTLPSIEEVEEVRHGLALSQASFISDLSRVRKTYQAAADREWQLGEELHEVRRHNHALEDQVATLHADVATLDQRIRTLDRLNAKQAERLEMQQATATMENSTRDMKIQHLESQCARLTRQLESPNHLRKQVRNGAYQMAWDEAAARYAIAEECHRGLLDAIWASSGCWRGPEYHGLDLRGRRDSVASSRRVRSLSIGSDAPTDTPKPRPLRVLIHGLQLRIAGALRDRLREAPAVPLTRPLGLALLFLCSPLG
jgi:flagellar motility protein MotE (MotC chaperone)